MTDMLIETNTRVVVRDRPWIVREVKKIANGHHLLTLEALDGEEPTRLPVSVPPDEKPQPLPTEDLCFELRQLDSLISWSSSHRILAATLVRETGLLSGARFGRVALEAYQLAPTLRLLAKPRPSLLVADDVGLGKTIEAGLAMLELMARGRVRRVLVVAPPGLMEQWRAELLEKFGLVFQIVGNASDLAAAQETLPAGVSPWDALPYVITSIDYLKKETVQNRALRKRWDLIIVDEAHALAESGTPQNPYRTQRTRLGGALRNASRSLLLLTATPHNGYAHAFRSLVELVEPTLATFSGSPEDLRRRVETAMIRRMKRQIRRRVDGGEVPVFPQRKVEGLPVPLSGPEKELLEKVSSYCSRTARQAEGTDEAELVGFAMQIVKKRALSSRRALLTTIENRLEALAKAEAREEAPSHAELRDYQADLPLTESQSERTARRILRSAIPKDEKRRRSELQSLKSIWARLKKLPDRDAKIEALLAELKCVFADDPAEKVIVFTEYRDTLEAIRARIDADPDLADHYVILHGGLTRGQRLRRQELFERPEIRVLLATDAASEGLNLQHHCRRVIHVELPWNPNRLEQRNGRVDRYGQSREPIIRFLYYPDSPEDDVLRRLVEKIEQMAADRVSTPDILGLIQGQQDLWQELVRLDAEAGDAESGKQGLVRTFEDRTEQFVRDLQPLLLASGGSEDELRRILDALDTPEPLLPDDESFERLVLGMLGAKAATPVPSTEGIYRIEVPWSYRGEGVEAVYPAATFRRSVAARTRPEEVEYITPLHPLVRALAADARRRLLLVYPNVRGLPPRRLAARIVPASEVPSALFTWLGRIEGGGGLLEEHLLTIRVGLDGGILGAPEENLRWLEPDEAGEVPREALCSLFEGRFEALREAARAEAERWLARRAEALRAHRRRQADILRQDLERDVRDRLRELDEEERHARGMIDSTGQQSLFAELEDHGFAARREVVREYRDQRSAEIAEFEQVSDPPPPRPLGALFLVPEGHAR
ncbi:helicase-related protein [Chthonomonas calidirosea]|uniref:helicase-related protein n=1 Tax=Chthonomonas calidirosea TaxID=454171 RepID=UPI00094896BB|nr:helicase-related protein [Chthonomonas calidirosea]